MSQHTETDPIRAGQESSVENVERQLAGPAPRILVGLRLISREAAWAATQSIRACWDADLAYDGQEKDDEGVWWAKGWTSPTSGVGLRIRLGGFPKELRR